MSQSEALARTYWRSPEVSPLHQYSWRLRLQNQVRPCQRAPQGLLVHPGDIRTARPASWTIAGTRPSASKRRPATASSMLLVESSDMGPCYRYRRNGRSAIVGERTTEGAVNVDAARAGENGDPAADCRDHQREVARGPARAGRGVRPPVLRRVAPEDLAERTRSTSTGPRWPTGALRTARRPARPRSGSTTPSSRSTAGSRPHTVVEIVTDDMPFLVDSVGHGAEPQRLWHPPDHPPGDHRAPRRGRPAGRGARRRDADEDGDPPSRSSTSRSTARASPSVLDGCGPTSSGARRRQGRRRGLAGHARAGRTSRWRELDEHAARRSTPTSWPRPGRSWSGWPTTTSPSSATAPTTWSARTARTCCAAVAGHGPRDPAPGPDQDGLAQLRQAAAGDPAPGPRAAPPHPDQGQLAAPPCTGRVPRLHRRQALRRRRARSSASAASSACTPRPPTTGNPRDIPCCAARSARCSSGPACPRGSHDGKALLNILETLPARRAVPDLRRRAVRDAMGILQLQERQRVRLFVRRDAFGRFVSCLVFVPRDRYNTTVRRRIEVILDEAFAGGQRRLTRRGCRSRCWPGCTSSSGVPPGEMPELRRQRELEARLAEATRSWTDDLHDPAARAARRGGGHRAVPPLRRGVPAPPTVDDFPARTAVADIAAHRGAGASEAGSP